MSKLPFTLTNLMTPEAKEKAPRTVVKVHQLVENVKRDIETNYQTVHVLGEISSFKPWRSGHWYFDLKDQFALLPCIMFRNLTSRVPFEVKDGQEVIVTAKVSVYALQSKIQLVVERMEPVGVGALALAFEQLKAKLQEEGLFAASKKKKLVPFPKVVGIVTSPQGAALADMLRVLRQRMPSTHVLLSPCRVQGQGSAAEIAQALKRLDESGECDTIILGRGGGSLEDLWSFNDEELARVIASCKTPIVSAVGHETDFSISDFVADIRAATPTHAAACVVPDAEELRKALRHQHARSYNALKAQMRQATVTLERFARRLSDPRILLMRSAQRLETLIFKARTLVLNKKTRNQSELLLLKKRLEQSSPMGRVSILSRRLKSLSERFWMLQPQATLLNLKQQVAHQERLITDLIMRTVSNGRDELRKKAAELSALSPLAVMSRGYAIVYKSGKQNQFDELVSSCAQVARDDEIRIRNRDGVIAAQVIDIKNEVSDEK